MKQDQYEKFVKELLSHYVEFPNDLRLGVTYKSNAVLIIIQPSPSDFGKVIGKESRALDALETLLNLKGSLYGNIIRIRLVEPEERVIVPRTDRKIRADWGEADNKRMADLLVWVIDQTSAINASVTVRPGSGETLLTIYSLSPMPMVVVDAINTIFRAIGAKQGWRLTVNERAR